MKTQEASNNNKFKKKSEEEMLTRNTSKAEEISDVSVILLFLFLISVVV